jgi:hypothetical protein
MINLVYDEIKPDDEMIGNQIKGDSKNGNAVTSKDGKALGNVSKRSLKTGERFKKNFDENLYGAEQMNGSYKRVPQPVDVAGDKKQTGSLGKAQKILNQLNVPVQAAHLTGTFLDKSNILSAQRDLQKLLSSKYFINKQTY